MIEWDGDCVKTPRLYKDLPSHRLGNVGIGPNNLSAAV